MAKPTREELWQHLLEQMEFLRASAQAFDQGLHAEAKRLASTTRTLLHSTDRSMSLLRQLKLLPGMAFWSTTRHPHVSPDAIEWDGGAHLLQLEYLPKANAWQFYAPGPCNDSPPLRPPRLLFFPDWWNETVITSQAGTRFSRRVIVLALANKLGGSHIEPKLSANEVELMSNPTWITYTVGDSESESAVAEVELHTMRQIAHEVLISIDRKLRV